MAVTRNDVDEVYGPNGKISSKPVVRDITTDANLQTLQQGAIAALAANATRIATAKPGTAALQASAAYDNSIAALRQCSGIIRLLLNQLDSTSGT